MGWGRVGLGRGVVDGVIGCGSLGCTKPEPRLLEGFAGVLHRDGGVG